MGPGLQQPGRAGMSQRVLEPGEIATLAQREIPRVILPRRGSVFAERAARLRRLAHDHPVGTYLELMGVIAEAQQSVLDRIDEEPLLRMQAGALAQASPAARAAQMPPLHAASLRRDEAWRSGLRELCRRCASGAGFPPGVALVLERLADATDDWLEAQADALLARPGAATEIDLAAAPFVMAALQLHWTALGLAVDRSVLAPMPDAPGLCPLCGSLPVASIVHASAPHAGYRYLACGLCACQWHYVRVQCSRCGAAGKDIAYQALVAPGADAQAPKDAAVRAETCERCHGYRKILYMEKDAAVEAIADDLATLALDLLLGELGYARASPNPLLWTSGPE